MFGTLVYMATQIYKTKTISLVDNRTITIEPLKIVYLKGLMDSFQRLSQKDSGIDPTDILVDCTRIAMKQFCPELDTKELVEDHLDLESMYDILDFGAGIKMRAKDKSPEPEDEDSKSDWSTLDLAALESEAFLLGIWKSYEEMELSISMPELVATLEAKRKSDYDDKKFFAAIQGVDLDKNNAEPNAWEKMKARVFSGGQSSDPNDIISLQGANAQRAGFGIGMGLSYERIE